MESDWASKAASATWPIGLASKIFLAKPSDEQGDPGGELLPGVGAAHELIGHRVVADDGPGDQLRKERDVAGEIDERPDRRGRAAIDVDACS